MEKYGFIIDFIGLIVFRAIQRHINNSQVIKIANAPTAKDAFLERMTLRDARRGMALIYATIFAVIYYFLLFFQSDGNTEIALAVSLGVFVFCLISMLISPKYHQSIDGISIYTKKEYLNEHHLYALFLRAFYTDKYGHDVDNVLVPTDSIGRKTELPYFSEQHFVSVLEKKMPVCAVGMTKEVEHPIGATRVYLEDESWQKDVLELMSKAKNIYILVDNRDSCIWEINQSFAFLDKTYFIINDISKYEQVRNKLMNSFELPQIPKVLIHAKQLFLRFEDNDGLFQSFENSIIDYQRILGINDLEDENIIGSFSGNDLFSHLSIDLKEDSDDCFLYSQIESICKEINEKCPLTIDELFTLEKWELANNSIFIFYDVDEE